MPILTCPTSSSIPRQPMRRIRATHRHRCAPLMANCPRELFRSKEPDWSTGPQEGRHLLQEHESRHVRDTSQLNNRPCQLGGSTNFASVRHYSTSFGSYEHQNMEHLYFQYTHPDTAVRRRVEIEIEIDNPSWAGNETEKADLLKTAGVKKTLPQRVGAYGCRTWYVRSGLGALLGQLLG